MNAELRFMIRKRKEDGCAKQSQLFNRGLGQTTAGLGPRRPIVQNKANSWAQPIVQNKPNFPRPIVRNKANLAPGETDCTNKANLSPDRLSPGEGKRAKQSQFGQGERPWGDRMCETNPIWLSRQPGRRPWRANVQNKANSPHSHQNGAAWGGPSTPGAVERAKRTQFRVWSRRAGS